MKKITGFFMAILPFFVTVLLFISGFIVKDITHIYVESVNFDQSTLDIKKPSDTEQPTEELITTVLPKNAQNKEVEYTSANSKIATISDSVVTGVDYGETYVYVTSKENQQIKDACKVSVWDDKVHRLVANNSFEVGYIPYYQSIKLDIGTVPSSRIAQDPMLTYEVSQGSSVIRVSKDGEITATVENDGQRHDAKVKVTCGNKEVYGDNPPSITIDVSVGPGVKYVEYNDPSPVITADTTYDLKDTFVTYPDNKAATTAGEVLYSVNDENTATVDANGLVTFKKAGAVDVTIKSARNQDVFATKTITSTSNYFTTVNFGDYEYNIDRTKLVDDEITPETINWYVYPESSYRKNVEVVSSDTNIVEVKNTDQGVKLYARKPGQVTLTATIKLDEKTTKSDTCVINIIESPSSTNGTIFKQDDITLQNTLYYCLRNNIDFNKILKNGYDKTKWEFVSKTSDDIVLDKDNETIIFTDESQSACVKLTTPDGKSYQFNISPTNVIEKELDFDKYQEQPVQVGLRYTFPEEYKQYTLEGNWSDYFIINQVQGEIKSVIPKKGGNPTLYVRNGLLITRVTIDFQIKEQPEDIGFVNANGRVYGNTFVTAKHGEDQLVKIGDLEDVKVNVYPATASDEEGKLAAENIKYEYSYDPSVAEVDTDENTIQFKKAGVVQVNVTVPGFETKPLYVYSTYGLVDKFNLNSLSTNETFISGSTITVDPKTPTQLKLSSLIPGIAIDEAYSSFNIENITQNGAANVTLAPQEECLTAGNILFNLSANADVHGTDTFAIKNSSFTFIIKVNSKATPQDFVVSYHGQNLTTLSSNVTFTNKLVLDVVTTPVITSDVDVYWKLNNETEVKLGSNKQIDLKDKLSDGENTLVIRANGYELTKTIKIDYQKDIKDFNLAEATSDNKVYTKANSVYAFATITLGGFADDEVYKGFKLEVTKDGQTREIDPDVNKFAINIDKPTEDALGYEADLKLTYGTYSKTYHLTREIVSRVEFPKHDNFDQSDNKGLQAVHVYGNQSYYNPTEGLIDYYKLPIKLYNFKNDEFTSDAKEQAFNTLVKTITQNSTYQYNKNENGFIEIHFNKDSLYTPKEIYDNIFDSLTNKNTYFSAHTHEYSALAAYSFVAVDGVNSYCQEGLLAANERANLVLQTNFGMEISEEESKYIENTKLDDPNFGDKIIGTVYGNGYLINFGAREKANKTSASFQNIFNVRLQGAYKTKPVSKIKFCFRSGDYPEDVKEHYIAYSEFMRSEDGLNMNSHIDAIKCYVKNCLFHDNAIYSLRICEATHRAYVQDCIFFNSSSFAILNSKAELYIKGFIDIYNFRGKEALDPWPSLAFAWDVLLGFARAKNMIQINPNNGNESINCGIANVLTNDCWFYTGQGESGYEMMPDSHPLAAKYLSPVGTLLGGRLGLWATKDPKYDPGAPSVYDEFKADGTGIREDFLPTQIGKITRQIKYF